MSLRTIVLNEPWHHWCEYAWTLNHPHRRIAQASLNDQINGWRIYSRLKQPLSMMESPNNLEAVNPLIQETLGNSASQNASPSVKSRPVLLSFVRLIRPVQKVSLFGINCIADS